MIIETFRQAIQNVWSNKLRTFLTMLGIIIGVMAVIVIVGLGNGMTKSMRDSFSALGTNTLSVQVWGNGSRTVSVEEMYKLPTEYPELIQSISPQIDFSGSGTLKIGTTSYRWSNISGVDENYSAMKNYQIAQGRGLQYMDMKDNKHVCVIGDYLNRVAFGGNGLGQTSALHGLDLGGSVLGPCEAQTLRNQVVASVAGLDGHDVARVTQVIDGLGENNLSFSHFSNLSKISDRKWRTAAEPSRGRS